MFAALLSIAAATAASPADEARIDSLERAWSKELNTVVVTGTRTPKLLKDSPVLTRVISAADIRKTDPTDIAELLQTELPGIEFSYSMNQQVNINMQGFGGNSVLFLVDGERLAGETLDNVDYNRLNLDGVARVEIVKGGASALYGSNAVGGVVNLISDESDEPWKVNVNARYGSHNDARYGAAASFSAGRVKSTTTLQYHSIGSYNMDAPGDYTRFYGGHNWSVKERISLQATDRLRLTGRLGYYFRQRNAQQTSRDRYRDLSAGLRAVYSFSPSSGLELSYGFDEYDKSDWLTTSKRDVRKYSNVQNSLRAIFTHTFAGRYTLTTGADIIRDYLQSYQFASGAHRSQITADALAQLDVDVTDRFNIVAGGRYDYFSEAAMQHVSGRLNAMYRLGRTTLRGSYSGGFRAPTLKEMYMDFDMAGIFMIYGNPDLRPESSHNFQLSADYSRRLLNLNAGVFCNLVDNRITTAWSRPLNGQVYTNIGRVTVAGAEANLAWRHPCGAGTRLSYMYTREHVRRGEPLTSSTRPHTATARFDYTLSRPRWSLMAALSGRVLSAVTVDEYTSLTDYSDTTPVRYPAYTMWRLNLALTLLRGITATLAVDNLFNYVPKYYYNNSPATTGTTFMAGISFDIDKIFRK